MIGGCIDQQAVFKVAVRLRGSGFFEDAVRLGRRVVHCSMGWVLLRTVLNQRYRVPRFFVSPHPDHHRCRGPMHAARFTAALGSLYTPSSAGWLKDSATCTRIQFFVEIPS